jgi:hypothetical protein
VFKPPILPRIGSSYSAPIQEAVAGLDTVITAVSTAIVAVGTAAAAKPSFNSGIRSDGSNDGRNGA